MGKNVLYAARYSMGMTHIETTALTAGQICEVERMAEICYNIDCPYCEHYQCKRSCTCITQLTDGYWYHGNGKLGGEFHPTKPNDEEHYGEYVKVVRCRDCKHLNKEEMRCFEVEGLGYRNVVGEDFCSRGVRKDEVNNG